MDCFADGLLQLVHCSIQLTGSFAFGGLLERAEPVGCAGGPPFVGLRFHTVIATPPIDINVMCDSVNPGREARPSGIGRNCIPDFAKGLLREVRSVGIVPAQAAEVAEDSFVVECEQRRSSIGISLL